MKKYRLGILLFFFCLTACISTRAAIFHWASTNSGDWNIATNWTPAQVPAFGDDVIITNGGSYQVTNTIATTVGHLILGGTNGIQTLSVTSLTFTNTSLVNSNGVLNWAGGDLESSLTIAHGATLSISNSVTFAINNANLVQTNTVELTNFGTVFWAGSATSYGNNNPLPHSGGTIIFNAGLWNAVNDNTLSVSENSSNLFLNVGTLQKTGGVGDSTINWSFNSTGTINTFIGAFNLNWNGSSILNGNLVLDSSTIGAPLVVATNAVLSLINGDDLESALTVAQGGTLFLSNSVSFSINNANLSLTNTSFLTNFGTVVWAGTVTSYGNNNSPPHSGGSIVYNAGLWESVGDNNLNLSENSSNLFINVGTLEKIAGTGISTINWNYDNQGGIIDTFSGSFSIGNWIGTGLVHGNATLSGGTISGTLAAGTKMDFSAIINGLFTVSSNAVANWNGGDLEGAMTVAQGGTLSISNSVSFAFNNAQFIQTNIVELTNYGTVIWAGGAISYGNNNQPPHSGGTIVYNAGTWQAVADNTMGVSENSSNLFINVGLLEKTGGSFDSVINWPLNSTGIIDTFTGAFTLSWNGNSILNGNLDLDSSTIGTPLTVASNALLILSSVDLEGPLTVAQGATLTLSNNVSMVFNNAQSGFTNTMVLTNFGTVIWAGTLTSYGNNNPPPNSGGSIIYNFGIWNAVADNNLIVSENSSNLFINIGTLEKTGGPTTSTINWGFYSQGGTLATPDGYFTFLGWDSRSVVHGNASVLANMSGTIASNAVINWIGGDLEGALTVAQGGTLSISNSLSFAFNNAQFGQTNTVELTNNGTVFWAGSVTSYGNNNPLPNSGGSIIYNAGLWQALGNDNLNVSENSSNLFINVGTVEKTGGAGTSTINWTFLNAGGILGSQTNTFSLGGDYKLAGGTLNFGLNSLANFGIIQLSGSPAVLAGSVSANLNFGYIPSTGNSFPVLTYGSMSGNFTNLISPFVIAMGSNYGSFVFSLTVLNVRPVFGSPAPQTVNELVQLTTPNPATDADGSQTLTYSLLSPPTGAGVNSSSGTVTWIPNEAQGPGTNIITEVVTDNGSPALSATNNFTVVINEINVAPVLTLPANQVMNEQTTLSLTATATDSDIPVNPLTFALVSGPTGLTVSTAGAIAWTPTEAQGSNTYTVVISVTDTNPPAVNTKSLSVTNSFQIIVDEVNLPPVLTVPANTSINELVPYSATATATDPDIPANTLTFGLVSGPTGLTVSTGGAINWTPSEAQGPSTNIVSIKVTDSNPLAVNSTSLSVTNSYTIIVNEVNSAPVLNMPPNTNINEQVLFTVNVTATDNDIPTNVLTFAVVSGPTNLAITPNGVLTWTPSEAQGPSTNIVTISVTDTNPPAVNATSLSVTNSFQIIVNEVNVAPVLPSQPDVSLNEGLTLTVTNTATDSDIPTNTLTYSLLAAPGAATISPNGIITWVTTEADGPGTNIIKTKVIDNGSPPLSATNSFTVIVNEVNQAPVVGALSNFAVNPGQTISFTATATDADIPANILTFSLVSPPTGATISGAGAFSWRPMATQANSTNIVKVRVTDNGTPNLSGTNSFTVTVNPLAAVILTPLGYASGQFKFKVNGTTGPDYIISSSSNLTVWIDLFTNFSPTPPFQFTNNNPVSIKSQFYRARLSP